MESRSRPTAVVAAHIIKFGLPIGLSLASVRIIYAATFSKEGLNPEEWGIAVTSLVMAILFGAVLGVLRAQRR